jgi:phospholipid/cholesterol/gamma-HCH transport system substrate-binding protein
MELRYKREALVGALIIVGALTFVFLMMWLRGSSLQRGTVVTAAFDDVAGLKVGDPVRTSGVRVGRVKTITLGGPDSVEVVFDVNGGQPPRADASVEIMSQDFFGARFIDYHPGVNAAALPEGGVLRGQRIEDIGEMASALGAQTRTLMDSLAVTSIYVAREMRVALRSTQTLLATLNAGAQGTTVRLQDALEALRRSLQRVELLVEQNGPAVGQTLRGMSSATVRLDSLTRSLTHASAQFDSVMVKLNSGRGPAAAMLNDSTIVAELRETNTALRDLLVDFKANPGRYIRLRL